MAGGTVSPEVRPSGGWQLDTPAPWGQARALPHWPSQAPAGPSLAPRPPSPVTSGPSPHWTYGFTPPHKDTKVPNPGSLTTMSSHNHPGQAGCCVTSTQPNPRRWAGCALRKGPQLKEQLGAETGLTDPQSRALAWGCSPRAGGVL